MSKDCMVEQVLNEKGTIFVNEQVGPRLYAMEVGAPLIARSLMPGQFVHVKVPGREAHLLRRPFSVYNATPELALIEILYQVVGGGSHHMTQLKLGDTLEMIGPLGNGWHLPAGAQRVLLVGGGVGAAPLYLFAKQLFNQGIKVDIILGAATKDALVCYERYKDIAQDEASSPITIEVATDDGSFGHQGFCTALVEEALATQTYDYGAVCGPEPMMRIVANIFKTAGIPSELSLEKRMACGVGACLSCVVETTEGMKRSCVDGPVFDARKVVFA